MSAVLVTLCPVMGFAFTKERAAAIVMGGATFYGGGTTGSLAGTTGFSFSLQAQPKKGLLRPTLGIFGEAASGVAPISGTQTSYSLYGGGFAVGVQISPFAEGNITPYISADGILGWNLLKLGSSSTTTNNTNSLMYGYVIGAGADIRLARTKGNAIRLQTGYLYKVGRLAGINSFAIQGFVVSIGYCFSPQ